MTEHAQDAGQRSDRVVASLDPVTMGSLDGAQLSSVLDEIGDAITMYPRRELQARRRRRAAPRLAALTGALVFAVAGAATAAGYFLSANTGTYPRTEWQRKAGGPGEYLNLADANFGQVALKASAGIPFPTGYGSWRTWIVTRDVGDQPSPCAKDATTNCKVEISTGALRGSFATVAFCAWVYDWRDAKRDGDSGRAAQAASAINRAPAWPAVRALDPHPSASPPYNDRGHKTLFGWFLPFRAAVVRGDVTEVNHLIADNYGTVGCSFVRPPAASKGGTVLPRHGSSS